MSLGRLTRREPLPVVVIERLLNEILHWILRSQQHSVEFEVELESSVALFQLLNALKCKANFLESFCDASFI